MYVWIVVWAFLSYLPVCVFKSENVEGLNVWRQTLMWYLGWSCSSDLLVIWTEVFMQLLYSSCMVCGFSPAKEWFVPLAAIKMSKQLLCVIDDWWFVVALLSDCLKLILRKQSKYSKMMDGFCYSFWTYWTYLNSLINNPRHQENRELPNMTDLNNLGNPSAY